MENDIEDINNSIPEELASDYVTPIKVDNFSLNADDLLYESKRNLNNNNNKGKSKNSTHLLYMFTCFTADRPSKHRISTDNSMAVGRVLLKSRKA